MKPHLIAAGRTRTLHLSRAPASPGCLHVRGMTRGSDGDSASPQSEAKVIVGLPGSGNAGLNGRGRGEVGCQGGPLAGGGRCQSSRLPT